MHSKGCLSTSIIVVFSNDEQPLPPPHPPPPEPLLCSTVEKNIQIISPHRPTTHSQTAAQINNIHNTKHQTEEPNLQPVHSTNININLSNPINIIAANKELIASNTNTVKTQNIPIYYRNQYSNSYKIDERVPRKIIHDNIKPTEPNSIFVL